VQEAQRRIGERGYSITRRNCQHFASECRNGTSFAPEVSNKTNLLAIINIKALFYIYV
jgi:hypothetical protein